LHAEDRALAALQQAESLLTPLDPQQHDLSEVDPMFSAYFVFTDKAGDLRLSMAWRVAFGTGPSKPEFDVVKMQWTRLDVDSGEAMRLVDINLTDLQDGSSWNIELSTEKPVPNDKLPPALRWFAQKVKISPDAVAIQDPLRAFVVYPPNPAMRRMQESRDYHYGLSYTDYTLELSRYQVKDTVPGHEHQTFEPRWSLGVYRTAWHTNFAHNQNLKVGESAPWSGDMEEWFPRDIGGPDTEQDVFSQLLKKLERVEAVVRSSTSQSQEKESI
jgi:hypothetical protein